VTQKISPTKNAAPAAAAKYKVRNGDTLWDIAQKFGLSIRDLMDMNKLNKSAIYAGQILLVK
jgi:LysM repeat protein